MSPIHIRSNPGISGGTNGWLRRDECA